MRTILLMQLSNLDIEATTTNKAVISLIKVRDRRKFRSRNMRQGMQIQIVKDPINAMANQIQKNRATNDERARVSLQNHHDERID